MGNNVDEQNKKFLAQILNNYLYYSNHDNGLVLFDEMRITFIKYLNMNTELLIDPVSYLLPTITERYLFLSRDVQNPQYLNLYASATPLSSVPVFQPSGKNLQQIYTGRHWMQLRSASYFVAKILQQSLLDSLDYNINMLPLVTFEQLLLEKAQQESESFVFDYSAIIELNSEYRHHFTAIIKANSKLFPTFIPYLDTLRYRALFLHIITKPNASNTPSTENLSFLLELSDIRENYKSPINVNSSLFAQQITEKAPDIITRCQPIKKRALQQAIQRVLYPDDLYQVVEEEILLNILKQHSTQWQLQPNIELQIKKNNLNHLLLKQFLVGLWDKPQKRYHFNVTTEQDMLPATLKDSDILLSGTDIGSINLSIVNRQKPLEPYISCSFSLLPRTKMAESATALQQLLIGLQIEQEITIDKITHTALMNILHTKPYLFPYIDIKKIELMLHRTMKLLRLNRDQLYLTFEIAVPGSHPVDSVASLLAQNSDPMTDLGIIVGYDDLLHATQQQQYLYSNGSITALHHKLINLTAELNTMIDAEHDPKTKITAIRLGAMTKAIISATLYLSLTAEGECLLFKSAHTLGYSLYQCQAIKDTNRDSRQHGDELTQLYFEEVTQYYKIFSWPQEFVWQNVPPPSVINNIQGFDTDNVYPHYFINKIRERLLRENLPFSKLLTSEQVDFHYLLACYRDHFITLAEEQLQKLLIKKLDILVSWDNYTDELTFALAQTVGVGESSNTNVFAHGALLARLRLHYYTPLDKFYCLCNSFSEESKHWPQKVFELNVKLKGFAIDLLRAYPFLFDKHIAKMLSFDLCPVFLATGSNSRDLQLIIGIEAENYQCPLQVQHHDPQILASIAKARKSLLIKIDQFVTLLRRIPFQHWIDIKKITHHEISSPYKELVSAVELAKLRTHTVIALSDTAKIGLFDFSQIHTQSFPTAVWQQLIQLPHCFIIMSSIDELVIMNSLNRSKASFSHTVIWSKLIHDLQHPLQAPTQLFSHLREGVWLLGNNERTQIERMLEAHLKIIILHDIFISLMPGKTVKLMPLALQGLRELATKYANFFSEPYVGYSLKSIFTGKQGFITLTTTNRCWISTEQNYLEGTGVLVTDLARCRDFLSQQAAIWQKHLPFTIFSTSSYMAQPHVSEQISLLQHQLRKYNFVINIMSSSDLTLYFAPRYAIFDASSYGTHIYPHQLMIAPVHEQVTNIHIAPTLCITMTEAADIEVEPNGSTQRARLIEWQQHDSSRREVIIYPSPTQFAMHTQMISSQESIIPEKIEILGLTKSRINVHQGDTTYQGWTETDCKNWLQHWSQRRIIDVIVHPTISQSVLNTLLSVVPHTIISFHIDAFINSAVATSNMLQLSAVDQVELTELVSLPSSSQNLSLVEQQQPALNEISSNVNFLPYAITDHNHSAGYNTSAAIGDAVASTSSTTDRGAEGEKISLTRMPRFQAMVNQLKFDTLLKLLYKYREQYATYTHLFTPQYSQPLHRLFEYISATWPNISAFIAEESFSAFNERLEKEDVDNNIETFDFDMQLNLLQRCRNAYPEICQSSIIDALSILTRTIQQEIWKSIASTPVNVTTTEESGRSSIEIIEKIAHPTPPTSVITSNSAAEVNTPSNPSITTTFKSFTEYSLASIPTFSKKINSGVPMTINAPSNSVVVPYTFLIAYSTDPVKIDDYLTLETVLAWVAAKSYRAALFHNGMQAGYNKEYVVMIGTEPMWRTNSLTVLRQHLTTRFTSRSQIGNVFHYGAISARLRGLQGLLYKLWDIKSTQFEDLLFDAVPKILRLFSENDPALSSFADKDRLTPVTIPQASATTPSLYQKFMDWVEEGNPSTRGLIMHSNKLNGWKLFVNKKWYKWSILNNGQYGMSEYAKIFTQLRPFLKSHFFRVEVFSTQGHASMLVNKFRDELSINIKNELVTVMIEGKGGSKADNQSAVESEGGDSLLKVQQQISQAALLELETLLNYYHGGRYQAADVAKIIRNNNYELLRNIDLSSSSLFWLSYIATYYKYGILSHEDRQMSVIQQSCQQALQWVREEGESIAVETLSLWHIGGILDKHAVAAHNYALLRDENRALSIQRLQRLAAENIIYSEEIAHIMLHEVQDSLIYADTFDAIEQLEADLTQLYSQLPLSFEQQKKWHWLQQQVQQKKLHIFKPATVTHPEVQGHEIVTLNGEVSRPLQQMLSSSCLQQQIETFFQLQQRHQFLQPDQHIYDIGCTIDPLSLQAEMRFSALPQHLLNTVLKAPGDTLFAKIANLPSIMQDITKFKFFFPPTIWNIFTSQAKFIQENSVSTATADNTILPAEAPTNLALDISRNIPLPLLAGQQQNLIPTVNYIQTAQGMTTETFWLIYGLYTLCQNHHRFSKLSTMQKMDVLLLSAQTIASGVSLTASIAHFAHFFSTSVEPLRYYSSLINRLLMGFMIVKSGTLWLKADPNSLDEKQQAGELAMNILIISTTALIDHLIMLSTVSGPVGWIIGIGIGMVLAISTIGLNHRWNKYNELLAEVQKSWLPLDTVIDGLKRLLSSTISNLAIPHSQNRLHIHAPIYHPVHAIDWHTKQLYLDDISLMPLTAVVAEQHSENSITQTQPLSVTNALLYRLLTTQPDLTDEVHQPLLTQLLTVKANYLSQIKQPNIKQNIMPMIEKQFTLETVCDGDVLILPGALKGAYHYRFIEVDDTTQVIEKLADYLNNIKSFINHLFNSNTTSPHLTVHHDMILTLQQFYGEAYFTFSTDEEVPQVMTNTTDTVQYHWLATIIAIPTALLHFATHGECYYHPQIKQLLEIDFRPALTIIPVNLPACHAFIQMPNLASSQGIQVSLSDLDLLCYHLQGQGGDYQLCFNVHNPRLVLHHSGKESEQWRFNLNAQDLQQQVVQREAILQTLLTQPVDEWVLVQVVQQIQLLDLDTQTVVVLQDKLTQLATLQQQLKQQISPPVTHMMQHQQPWFISMLLTPVKLAHILGDAAAELLEDKVSPALLNQQIHRLQEEFKAELCSAVKVHNQRTELLHQQLLVKRLQQLLTQLSGTVNEVGQLQLEGITIEILSSTVAMETTAFGPTTSMKEATVEYASTAMIAAVSPAIPVSCDFLNSVNFYLPSQPDVQIIHKSILRHGKMILCPQILLPNTKLLLNKIAWTEIVTFYRQIYKGTAEIANNRFFPFHIVEPQGAGMFDMLSGDWTYIMQQKRFSPTLLEGVALIRDKQNQLIQSAIIPNADNSALSYCYHLLTNALTFSHHHEQLLICAYYVENKFIEYQIHLQPRANTKLNDYLNWITSDKELLAQLDCYVKTTPLLHCWFNDRVIATIGDYRDKLSLVSPFTYACRLEPNQTLQTHFLFTRQNGKVCAAVWHIPYDKKVPLSHLYHRLQQWAQQTSIADLELGLAQQLRAALKIEIALIEENIKIEDENSVATSESFTTKSIKIGYLALTSSQRLRVNAYLDIAIDHAVNQAAMNPAQPKL